MEYERAGAGATRDSLSFGLFELNSAEESLSRNSVRVKVQDLPFRLLEMLVERPGEIITRERVRQRVWIDEARGKSSAAQLGTDLASLQLRIADAYKKGYFEAAAKAQLAFLEIEVRRGSESAQSRMTRLVESCRARGYIAIANSASAVLATSKARTS
jgi:hypothetical protein